MILFATQFIKETKELILENEEFKALLGKYNVKQVVHVATYEKQPTSEPVTNAYNTPAVFISIDLMKTDDEESAMIREMFAIDLYVEDKNLNEEQLLQHYALTEIIEKGLKSKIKNLYGGKIMFDKTNKNNPRHIISFTAYITQRQKCLQ